MQAQTSVITLVSGRKAALNNLIKGLSLGTQLPSELVVVFMNEKISELPKVNFPIISVELFSDEKYPLAKARNLGAQKASFNHLIFLDVDCIPEKTLVQTYNNNAENKLYSGIVRYLPKDAMKVLDFDKLDQLSDEDPVRSNINLTYELFWSLNFACNRLVFEKIGGFNENFKGYGAEDTDFAFRARAQQVPLEQVDAKAYHQYHPSYSPPLNHLTSIVENANVFKKIWDKWPMEGWLKKFEEMGFVKWGDELKIIRQATEIEIANAKKETK